jgi:predicted transcriptional regulator
MENAMATTTSLKLPDDLKATIAKVAAFEGKTAHALMVDTLQAAMEDALVRQQFYADGEAAYQDTLRTNTVYAGADVKAYVMARVKGGKGGGTTAAKPLRPQAKALVATKPRTAAHD